MLLLLLFSLSSSGFDKAELLSTPVVYSPRFDKSAQRVLYDIDFIFKKCPEEYVLYYSREQKKMVLDFYSATVFWADSVLPNTFNGELLIRNVETKMSISGQKGQILFTHQREWDFEQDWHYESAIESGKTLRVCMWKYLKPAMNVKQKKTTTVDSAE